MVRLFFRRINQLLVIGTLFLYATALVSPALFWPAGLLTFLIPVAIVANIVFLLFWWRYWKAPADRTRKAARRRHTAIYSAAVLLIGFPFLRSTFSVSWPSPESDFSVLSYNVRVFNNYTTLHRDEKECDEMIQSVADHPADIKCFQEFYHKPGSKLYNTKERIARKGQYEYYFHPLHRDRAGAQFGLAIFSKWPIVNKGKIELTSKRQGNRGIFADVVVNGKDTVRIMNVHLESMAIRYHDPEAFQKESLIRKLRRGLIARSVQIEQVADAVRQSPYPVVLCADLNEMPYSYAYFRLKKLLYNAFEDAGNGFGFTFQGGPLFFLRIDHQFYSKGLSISSFQTQRQYAQSDHFPIVGKYRVVGGAHRR